MTTSNRLMFRQLGIAIAAFVCALPLAMADEPLRVMSFNVRYASRGDGDNVWPNRKALVLKTIKNFAPDVLGLQEPLPAQMDYLEEQLPSFVLVGCGRDNGKRKGEFTAMLIKRDRLRIVEQGRAWFSETPMRPGSKGFGAGLPRLFVWALLQDREKSDREFLVYNTHFDHRSALSRERGAAMMAEDIAKRSSGRPVIAMGDFNTPLQSKAMQTLIGGKIPLADTFAAKDREPVGTFNGFRGTTGGKKIDFVLASNLWTVKQASIDRSNDNGRYPSDHFPVTAVLDWPRLSAPE